MPLNEKSTSEVQCHCGLAGGFCGGASSFLRRGSISQYGHAGDWATRLVYIFSGLVFFGRLLLPWEDAAATTAATATADCSVRPQSRTHHNDVRLPRAPAALRFLPTSHFPQGGERTISPVKHRPEMEMRLAALTSPCRRRRSSASRSMAAIFSLAAHEGARDVNVSLCLLNTQ